MEDYSYLIYTLERIHNISLYRSYRKFFSRLSHYEIYNEYVSTFVPQNIHLNPTAIMKRNDLYMILLHDIENILQNNHAKADEQNEILVVAQKLDTISVLSHSVCFIKMAAYRMR